MYSQFQASYQRVDVALQRLTDSIAAYNPSVSAADELVAADEAVNRDIEQLVKHQRNHQRIQDLRRTADNLDDQIKNTLRLLAETRKELQAIPSSDPSETRREVKVDELLSYAKFIAKTTVPPTFRKPVDLPSRTDKTNAPQIANGMATPPPGTSQNNENPAYVEEGRAVKELQEKDKAWLLPTNLPFDPWPSGDMMRQGALGRIQKMLEDGVDPAGVLTAEEQAEVDRKRREEEERQRLEEEERSKRAREEFGYGMPRRSTIVEETPFNPDDL